MAAPVSGGQRTGSRGGAPPARRGGTPVLLWVVLLLVLGSFGLLVAALVTSRTGWAWGSVGASGLAAALLIMDWVSRRGAVAPAPAWTEPEAAEPVDLVWRLDEPPGTGDEDTAEWARAGGPPPGGRWAESPEWRDWADPAEEPGARPNAGPAAADADSGDEPDAVLDPDVEPPEERADVADALAVTELTDEVVVIDERPRYHLAGCRWVGDRETIPLPLAEARELGFTPCAVCTPDRWMAARHRAARARESALRRAATLEEQGDDPAITGEPPEERASRPQ